MRRQGAPPAHARRSVMALVLISLLAACGGFGDSRAAKAADEAADALALRWTAPQAVSPRPASWYATSDQIGLVATAHTASNVAIEPVRWEGTSNEDGAEIDVRIVVHLPADTDNVFGSTREASDATRCYRFVIIANRNYDQVEHKDISCPDGPAPDLPTPSPPARLPEDTKTRVEALLRSSDAETLAADVQAEFTDDDMYARSAVDAGRLIVTVGIAGESEDCVVGVRGRNGRVTFEGFPREWLQPGEIGCDPMLVTNPPR